MVPKDASSNLLVSVQSLVVSNSRSGTMSFPDETRNLTMAVDSTTSQMWLPRSICDKLESAFGLNFDNNTGLYLVNATVHSQLLNLNPEITFTLAANASTSLTTNIVLPYAALDLVVGVPFYNSTSPIRYFPIRRAENSTQYTLGRALLQEAYLIVDYERSNFTIGQTNHTSQRSIVPISSPQPKGGKSLGAGAIAGIVIAAVVVVALLVISAWLALRHRSRKSARAAHELAGKEHAETSSEDEKIETSNTSTTSSNQQVLGGELMSGLVHEMDGDQARYQLMSSPVHEMPAVHTQHELPGHANEAREKR